MPQLGVLAPLSVREWQLSSCIYSTHRMCQACARSWDLQWCMRLEHRKLGLTKQLYAPLHSPRKPCRGLALANGQQAEAAPTSWPGHSSGPPRLCCLSLQGVLQGLGSSTVPSSCFSQTPAKGAPPIPAFNAPLPPADGKTATAKPTAQMGPLKRRPAW